MRLFVAIEVGSAVRGSLSRAVDELKGRTERLAPAARVTWVRPEQLHITVRFIGHVDRAAATRILAALAPPLRSDVCVLEIGGTGTFPPRRPPRVVWAGITSGVDGLRAVEHEVSARLQSVTPPHGGAARDERDYHPHVTLGRVKNPAGLRPAPLLDGFERVEFGAVTVEAVTLFESRPSPAGSLYVPLARTGLARTS